MARGLSLLPCLLLALALAAAPPLLPMPGPMPGLLAAAAAPARPIMACGRWSWESWRGHWGRRHMVMLNKNTAGGTVLNTTALYCTVLYCTVLYYAALYGGTVLYCVTWDPCVDLGV